MRDFAAIDFETANEQPSSVCSVGVVIVRDGEIVDSFYSLIHPEPEYYQWFCQQVHGEEAHIVTGLLILLAGISQSHNQPVHSGGFVSEQHRMLL